MQFVPTAKLTLAALIAGVSLFSFNAVANDDFAKINRLATDVQQIIKYDARDRIKTGIQDTVKRPYRITSEDRTTPKSIAHDRGAVDFSSKEVSARTRHTEAQRLSQKLGPYNRVVVEEVRRDTKGRKYQVDTTYQNGGKGNTRVHEKVRASATHTHAQPNYGINLNPRPAPAQRVESRQAPKKVDTIKRNDAPKKIESPRRPVERASPVRTSSVERSPGAGRPAPRSKKS